MKCKLEVEENSKLLADGELTDGVYESCTLTGVKNGVYYIVKDRGALRIGRDGISFLTLNKMDSAHKYIKADKKITLTFEN